MIIVTTDGECDFYSERCDHYILLNSEVVNNLINALKFLDSVPCISTRELPSFFDGISENRMGESGCSRIKTLCRFIGTCEPKVPLLGSLDIYVGTIGSGDDKIIGVFLLHNGKLPHSAFPRLWTSTWIVTPSEIAEVLRQLSVLVTENKDFYLEEVCNGD